MKTIKRVVTELIVETDADGLDWAIVTTSVNLDGLERIVALFCLEEDANYFLEHGLLGQTQKYEVRKVHRSGVKKPDPICRWQYTGKLEE